MNVRLGAAMLAARTAGGPAANTVDPLIGDFLKHRGSKSCMWWTDGSERVTTLSTYRSKNDPELRVAGQDEPNQVIETPAALNRNAIEKLLTPREAEIARLVAAGLSNKQIARKARIAEGTVKIHLHKAYQKLGIANRAGLAVFMFSSDAGVMRSNPLRLPQTQEKPRRATGAVFYP
jgi:DNA-binding CsgD family transcriptional regulator